LRQPAEEEEPEAEEALSTASALASRAAAASMEALSLEEAAAEPGSRRALRSGEGSERAARAEGGGEEEEELEGWGRGEPAAEPAAPGVATLLQLALTLAACQARVLSMELSCALRELSCWLCSELMPCSRLTAAALRLPASPAPSF
jgi:hypothetical protein